MRGEFDRAYRLWTYLHSAFLFLATLLMSPVFTFSEELFLWVLAPYTVLIMVWLYSLAELKDRGPADLLTGTRGFAAMVLFLYGALRPELPILNGGSFLWILLAFLLLVELTDFFDGRLARKRGCSSFGAVWDMENDALFMFSLALVGYVHLGFPVWALLIGLMRYLYFLAFRVTGDPPGYPDSYKRFAKSVAALIAVGLLAAYAPLMTPFHRGLLLAPVLLLQTISFGWDLLLQAKAGRIRVSQLREEEIPRKMETWR